MSRRVRRVDRRPSLLCYGSRVATKKRSEPAALQHNPFAALRPEGSTDAASEPEPNEPPAPEPEKGWGAGKIVLRREKKGRGGKTVTRIEGLPSARLPALAAEMKRGLGCGAKVEGDALILLGSLVDRAAAWLRDQGAPRIVEGN